MKTLRDWQKELEEAMELLRFANAGELSGWCGSAKPSKLQIGTYRSRIDTAKYWIKTLESKGISSMNEQALDSINTQANSIILRNKSSECTNFAFDGTDGALELIETNYESFKFDNKIVYFMYENMLLKAQVYTKVFGSGRDNKEDFFRIELV